MFRQTPRKINLQKSIFKDASGLKWPAVIQSYSHLNLTFRRLILQPINTVVLYV